MKIAPDEVYGIIGLLSVAQLTNDEIAAIGFDAAVIRKAQNLAIRSFLEHTTTLDELATCSLHTLQALEETFNDLQPGKVS